MARQARTPEPAGRFTQAPLPQAPLDTAQRLACLRLIRSENVGPVTFRELINHYGGAQQAIDALPELARRGGRGRPIRVCTAADAERELASAEAVGSRPLFTIEPGYPPALAGTGMPPPLIYAKGDISLLTRPAVAVVGSRQASAAGLKLTRQFAQGLAVAGYAIVSGLARGIDAAAHHASLASGTIAVVAGGIDVVYPPENDTLQRSIGERGVLVSEMPPGFEPRGRDFPRRNRIIAGIALGVVVVEAARRSGTLMTARLAAEAGRDVFAVPGHPLDPRAEGTNQLLKGGAIIATEPSDVVEALASISGLSPQQALAEAAPHEPWVIPAMDPPPAPPVESDRARVLEALSPAPVDIDSIARTLSMPMRTVNVVLMELELAGLVARHGSQLVSRLA